MFVFIYYLLNHNDCFFFPFRPLELGSRVSRIPSDQPTTGLQRGKQKLKLV